MTAKIVSLTLLSLFVLGPVLGDGNSPKSLLGLIELLHCANPNVPISHLAKYADYGCWCGVGGSGTPVDPMDACCMHHDGCYTDQENAGCHDYIDGYKWTCDNATITCTPGQHKCAMGACACDQGIANCIHAAGGEPIPAHFNYCPSPEQQ